MNHPLYFLAGSFVEGQGYAKQFAPNLDKLQDVDLMHVVGEIDSNNELIPIDANVPGYIYVRWNGAKLASLPYTFNDKQQCRLINGFVMKQ
ncbi:unnamed protein product, partial [Didymodactylos carnosus]